VRAREVDEGRSLRALLDLAGFEGADAIPVGDAREVRSIVHPHRGRCARCERGGPPAADDLFLELLKEADRRPLGSLARALADPLSLQAFLR